MTRRLRRKSEKADGSERFIEAAERQLRVRFDDKALLTRALTHRSFAYEAGLTAADTNERMEFLGDAVLDLVVSDFLYLTYPDLSEGDLTRKRARLVNTTALARVAAEAGIGPLVQLSRDERADGGGSKPSILADTLEAVIGAVFLDRGLPEARSLVLRLLKKEMEEVVTGAASSDPKTELQELVVQNQGDFPLYEMDEEGPPHARVFHSRVYVGSMLMGVGSGRSKKEAEQAAAAEALQELRSREKGEPCPPSG